MKHLALLTVLLSVSFHSWSQLSSESIEVNGVTRSYYQYLPTGYDPGTEQVPIVFLLHGIGGTAANCATYGLNPIADTARFIAIYPQGVSNGSQTSWNNGTFLASNAEDVLFVSRLIDSLNNDYNINLARVYMSGISMGSIMTYTLCNQLSDRIAAAGCMIGTMSTTDYTSFAPTYPVPTIHSHGTADGTVPYNSGALPSLTLVPQTLEKLKTTNGFQGDSVITAIPDNAADGITIDKIVYNCTTPLEHWKWNNADHTLMYQPANDTTVLIYNWHFFYQFTHPNPSTASIDHTAAPKVKMYPNPSKGKLTIVNHDQFESLMVYSMDGQEQFKLTSLASEIDMSSLSPGSYILQFVDKSGRASIERFIIQ